MGGSFEIPHGMVYGITNWTPKEFLVLCALFAWREKDGKTATTYAKSIATTHNIPYDVVLRTLKSLLGSGWLTSNWQSPCYSFRQYKDQDPERTFDLSKLYDIDPADGFPLTIPPNKAIKLPQSLIYDDGNLLKVAAIKRAWPDATAKFISDWFHIKWSDLYGIYGPIVKATTKQDVWVELVHYNKVAILEALDNAEWHSRMEGTQFKPEDVDTSVKATSHESAYTKTLENMENDDERDE